jgi:WD40 repeat protein
LVFCSCTKLVHTLSGHTEWVGVVAYSPDGKHLVSGGDDGTLKIWEAATGTLLRSIDGIGHFIGAVSYSPDGNYVAAGIYDSTVKIWNVSNGKLVPAIN